MFVSNIVLLAGVFEHVEELFVNEAVLVVPDGEVFPLVVVWFRSGRPASFLSKEVPIGPG